MITDNSENNRQIDWLASQNAERLLVASGYFEPRIWRNPRTGEGISDSLKNLKEFKLSRRKFLEAGRMSIMNIENYGPNSLKIELLGNILYL